MEYAPATVPQAKLLDAGATRVVFSSVLFLFLFLPLVLAGYYVVFLPGQALGGRLGIRLGNLFLLLTSLLFYAWGEKRLVLVMLGSILLDYVCGLVISGAWRDRAAPVRQLERGTPRTRAQRAALIASVVGNLTALGVFKYFNFAIDNVNAVAAGLGLEWLVAEDVVRIALPIGISFYTFQSLSYTIDVYRGDARASRNLLDFACFVTLFPQLVAGPIVRYRDVAAQLEQRVVGRSEVAHGMTRFALGLAKKVLIANTVAIAADGIFALPSEHLTPGLAWLGVLSYFVQIYFDFSAYSDMAIGIGHMLGFRLLENFDHPYVAASIQDFWRRWHMSLSTWFRDYLYVPLGGNRVSPARTYVNLLVVFVLCGLWHGANWTFLAWGLLHGTFLILERVGLKRALERLPWIVRNAYVFLVVMCGWAVFRAETLTQAGAFLAAMVGSAPGTGEVVDVTRWLNRELVVTLAAGLALAYPVLPWCLARWRGASARGGAPLELAGQGVRLAAVGVLLVACAMALAAGTHNPFIYFRF